MADQQIGRLEAKVELLLKEAEDAKVARQEQSKRLAKIEQDFASLRLGGRVLLWVAGAFGTIVGLAANWGWKVLIAVHG